MLLDSTVRKIQAQLASAPTTTAPTFYTEIFNTVREQNFPGQAYTGVLGAAASDIVPFQSNPNGNVATQVEEIIIYNADSVNAIVSIIYNDNGTLRILKKSTLTPGQSLTYQRYIGGFVVS